MNLSIFYRRKGRGLKKKRDQRREILGNGMRVVVMIVKETTVNLRPKGKP